MASLPTGDNTAAIEAAVGHTAQGNCPCGAAHPWSDIQDAALAALLDNRATRVIRAVVDADLEALKKLGGG